MWKGVDMVIRGFHNTGQGQVHLPVSLFRFLSPFFSPLFSLFPFFCISFLSFACVCGGGVGIAVIWGVSPILGKDKSFSFFLLSSSFSLHFYLFLLLCSSFCLSLLLHCWCVWRGGLALQWMNFTVKTRIWKSVPWSVCKQNRCRVCK